MGYNDIDNARRAGHRQPRAAAAAAVESMEPRVLMSAGGPGAEAATVSVGDVISDRDATAWAVGEPLGGQALLSAGATAGDLDPAFGAGDGVVPVAPLAFPADGGGGTVVALGGTEAGKVLVAGTSGGRLAAARYLADGTPDLTFGGAGTGWCALDVPGHQVSDVRAAVGHDGRVVLAGTAVGTGEFVVARLTAAGTPDRTFAAGGADGDGRATVRFPAGPAVARAVTVDAAGRPVVAGSVGADFAVARLTAAGVADPTFGGGDGRVAADFGGGRVDAAHAVGVQADGRVVLAGSSASAATGLADAAVARLNADGSQDRSFGPSGNGRMRVDLGGRHDVARGLAVLPAGAAGGGAGLLLVGSSDGDGGDSGDSGDALLVRLGAAGGVVRKLRADVEGSANGAAAVAVDARTGRFVVAGSARHPGAGGPFAVVSRYKADLAPDASFGAGGHAVVYGGGGAAEGALSRAVGVSVRPDGGVLVAASADDREAGAARPVLALLAGG